MHFVTVLTLLCFFFFVLAIIAASPFLLFVYLIPKLGIRLADRLELQSCYTYTWRQFSKERGSILITRSRYGWWGHVMWINKVGDVLEYRDLKPGLAYRQWKPLPPLWFKGKVVKVGALTRQKPQIS